MKGWSQKKKQFPSQEGEVGLHVPNVIDYIWTSPDGQEFSIVMIQQTPWTGSDLEAKQLVDKTNLYVNYVESGQFHKDRPDAVGKKFHLALDAPTAPLPMLAQGIASIQEILAKRGIEFKLNILG
jgi:hypothetical protein